MYVTSFSHSPEIIQKGNLTFCCCRNSCHYTHLPHLSLWCQIPVFTRNLPVYWQPTSIQVPGIPGNKPPGNPGLVSTAYGSRPQAILKPSSSHPPDYERWTPSLTSLIASSSHRKQVFEAQMGILARSTVNACQRVSNYCFTAKLAPAPTKIHGMQKELQELFCCS